jgi:hypothetical protein
MEVALGGGAGAAAGGVNTGPEKGGGHFVRLDNGDGGAWSSDGSPRLSLLWDEWGTDSLTTPDNGPYDASTTSCVHAFNPCSVVHSFA